MKLEKAIEILKHPLFYPSTPSEKDYADAVKLGIEALERITYQRNDHLSRYTELLPSETKK